LCRPIDRDALKAEGLQPLGVPVPASTGRRWFQTDVAQSAGFAYHPAAAASAAHERHGAILCRPGLLVLAFHGEQIVSSIRPLATITLLALVGVFLYMKINETGPQLPADIANWTMPTELEIGTSPAPGGLTESANPSPPATSTAPSYSAPRRR